MICLAKLQFRRACTLNYGCNEAYLWCGRLLELLHVCLWCVHMLTKIRFCLDRRESMYYSTGSIILAGIIISVLGGGSMSFSMGHTKAGMDARTRVIHTLELLLT